METQETTVLNSDVNVSSGLQTKKTEESFFPSGAIAFFILLVLLCGIIWFGIYFLMLHRI